MKTSHELFVKITARSDGMNTAFRRAEQDMRRFSDGLKILTNPKKMLAKYYRYTYNKDVGSANNGKSPTEAGLIMEGLPDECTHQSNRSGVTNPD